MTFTFTEMDYSTMYTVIKEFALVDKSEAYKNGDKAEVVGYKDARLGKAYINIAFILDEEGWIYTIGVFKDADCEEAICLMQVITEFDGSHPVVVPLDEEQYISCFCIPEAAIRQGATRL
jgi:hypothetical protein